MGTPQRVLVVCTANVCRSPLAQRVLRAAELPFEVDSAGLRALEGAPICAMSADELRAEELRAEELRADELHADVLTADQHIAHVARQVDADAVRAADLVVAMEREQRGALVRAAPGSQAKVFTLREAATFAAALAGRGTTVPDLAAAARAMHGLRGLVSVPEWPAPPRRWFRRPPEPADPLTIADGHGAAEPEHRAAIREVHAAADRLATSLRAILPASQTPAR